MVIRPATNADIPALSERPVVASFESADQPELEAFFQNVWQDAPFPFDPDGAHADLRLIATAYQVDGGGFWLMKDAEEIVGTIAVRRLSHDVAEIKRFNILRQERGRGFGEALLRHAISHAKNEDFRAVRLDTFRDGGPAVHLFRKQGFVEIARYNDNPHAGFFMELDLR
ncbi:MAG: GNAT family N-acetyltransferase [Vicinamibacterales bacterium]